MKTESPFYIAKTGIDAKERLALQHRVFAPGTEMLLDMANFHPQMHVLVIGCGCGDETIMIAEKINQQGCVVAIDMNPEQIEQAKLAAANAGVGDKIIFLTKSIEELDTLPDKFDLILSRLVIMHLADPQQVIQLLKAHLNSGGILAAQELIISSCVSKPKSSALQRYMELMLAFGKLSGRNFDIAKELPKIFEKSGLETSFKEWQPIVIGPDKRMSAMSVQECTPALITAGLLTAAEADQLLVDINREIVNREDVVLFQCINVLLIGKYK